MNNNDPLLKVRFDGTAIGTGRIPATHLRSFIDSLEKALVRTGRILTGDSTSLHRGAQSNKIKDEIELDLVLLTHGSPAAVLGFERRKMHQPLRSSSLPGIDFGLNIFEKSVAGLIAVQKQDEVLPAGYDVGVLKAWRDTGKLFSRGVERIEFTLNHRQIPLSAVYTPQGLVRIQERIKEPQVNIRTIEGRLLMADFKEHGARCRIHPSVGEPVLCLFDDEQEDEIEKNIRRYVRITGEAKEDSASGRITSVKIHGIEALEEITEVQLISRDFWNSPTLNELAKAQHVQPIEDVRTLFGTWPGEEDDGFEDVIKELRYRGVAGGRR
ncbi:hypothetical protein VU07_02015 [Desulfobulbus sp. F4]|nr:hypothetical protein [Desulfobulbus sp. F4]